MSSSAPSQGAALPIIGETSTARSSPYCALVASRLKPAQTRR